MKGIKRERGRRNTGRRERGKRVMQGREEKMLREEEGLTKRVRGRDRTNEGFEGKGEGRILAGGREKRG